MNTAAKVAKHKEANPHLYCSKCLWKTGGGNCPRHGGGSFPLESVQIRSCSEVAADETARAIRDQQIEIVNMIQAGREQICHITQ
jgi:hypothetical protein